MALCVALLLTTCGNQPGPAPEPIPEPDPTIEQNPIDPDVQKYFEYYTNPYNAGDAFMMYTPGPEEDNCANRAAYVLAKLAAEEMAAGKEATFSYPKAVFDRAAMEYLGEPITTYENRMSTITPEGNIAATGWGMIYPDLMVLNHLEKVEENHYRGTFTAYGNPYPGGEPMEEPFEDYCQRLMRGNILPTDCIIGDFTLEWEEWKSPLLGLQLWYLSREFTSANK